VKLVTQTCARCGELFKVETDLLGNADSSICVPCLTKQPLQFENDPRRQRVLFSGMDCLRGQLDLFQTDGEGGVE
jgi:hypothetical protein